MLSAFRLSFMIVIVVFAVIGFTAETAATKGGGVALISGAIIYSLQGFNQKVTAFEVLIATAFTLGFATGSIPYLVAKVAPANCIASGSERALIIWLVGTIITVAGSVTAVVRFRPRLRLNKVAFTRWFWLLTGGVMMASACGALISDPCGLDGDGSILILPTITNAIIGLYVGWYSSERTSDAK
jgi:hypothetical protein